MKTFKIEIVKNIGECISVEEFANGVSKYLNQPAENITFALSFMVPELGLVDALNTYAETCGFITY